ncbi:hypothetical protein LCGC14_0922820 [marine sediment metagenome]|uniref:DUF5610 domain-containing protein n=1 Tax=marine sediment metagenome TaxID=412755 RepID=A0A0F9PAX3_9ZZZZ|nr:hypothetical protein [Methylophaga sp.]HEC58093.1 hypothetical protein [Methylophaga sp.]
MDIKTNNVSSLNQNKNVSSLNQNKNAAKTQESTTSLAKKQLNAAILQSTVDINASNKPLSLTFKAAIEGINDALKETLGDNAIQSAYDSGIDVSPDATADRIVSLSTAFFGAYQKQHPELSQEDALTQFTDIISSGINTGFSEARDILKGLNVLDGDIASNIDLTYDLVQKKLTDFIDSFGQTAEAE